MHETPFSDKPLDLDELVFDLAVELREWLVEFKHDYEVKQWSGNELRDRLQLIKEGRLLMSAVVRAGASQEEEEGS
ncbi:MAG: hypothetical protein AAGI68_17090 [Planctomycetota bacterium]